MRMPGDPLRADASVVMEALAHALGRLFMQQQARHQHQHPGLEGKADWWTCPCPCCVGTRHEMDDAVLDVPA